MSLPQIWFPRMCPQNTSHEGGSGEEDQGSFPKPVPRHLPLPDQLHPFSGSGQTPGIVLDPCLSFTPTLNLLGSPVAPPPKSAQNPLFFPLPPPWPWLGPTLSLLDTTAAPPHLPALVLLPTGSERKPGTLGQVWCSVLSPSWLPLPAENARCYPAYHPSLPLLSLPAVLTPTPAWGSCSVLGPGSLVPTVFTTLLTFGSLLGSHLLSELSLPAC